MERYHFHLADDQVHLDLDVAELASDDDVLAHAERLASALLNPQGSPYAANPNAWEIRVTTDTGTEVLALRLSEIARRMR